MFVVIGSNIQARMNQYIETLKNEVIFSICNYFWLDLIVLMDSFNSFSCNVQANFLAD